MTRKDYELIAAYIRNSRAGIIDGLDPIQEIDSVTAGLADRLAADNPQFNRDRFLAACGID